MDYDDYDYLCLLVDTDHVEIPSVSGKEQVLAPKQTANHIKKYQTMAAGGSMRATWHLIPRSKHPST